ncbi:cysteine hydrolase family protein [Anaeromicropila herbilytica]|uniref:nicotinamidase n=1 Tax=Anaeromicropila herbilytica TaxID=2785025 RepID=A0A7R7EMV2_9FIRM|nr:isochorismatase family cysteine hydrolase [Anaeromicropila herbilytica]BCN31475.1 amidase [Anaeromicropila herbilytica]
MSKVLLVIDMQNDFIDGSLGTKEAVSIVPKVVEKIKVAKAEGTDIIFTKDTHSANYLTTMEGKKLPVEHCIKPSHGWEIREELLPYVESVVEKGTFGSIDLPELVSNYDTIELVGLCTDICVISNALLLKANFPEKEFIVDSTCCAGVTKDSHKNALEAMKMCHIDVI